MTVLVTVYGGVVTGVSSTEPVSVCLIDYDVAETGDEDQSPISIGPAEILTEDEITDLMEKAEQEHKDRFPQLTLPIGHSH